MTARQKNTGAAGYGDGVVVSPNPSFAITDPDIVLNQLYRFSQLQSSFGVNALALDGGRPLTFDLHGFIRAFRC